MGLFRLGLLRSVFDSPWLHRHRPSAALGSQNRSGAFGYRELRQPHDLLALSRQTLRRAALILARITHPHPARNTQQPTHAFLSCIRDFDRLSDVLCRVIDLAEAIRNLHPDHAWVAAANQAHNLLSRYMNTLNTHQQLYQTLESSLSRLQPADHVHPDLFAAKTVAQQFVRDFQRHGIHLPSQERKKLVELSDEILVVGRMFFAGTSAASSYTPTWITREEAKQLGPSSQLVRSQQLHFDMHGRAALDPSDYVAHTILQQHPSEAVRRRIWQSQRESPDEQIELLDTLLKLRHQFAKLTGKHTWAEVVLQDKMAGSPENVLAFLDGLAQDTRPLALQELDALRSQTDSNNTIQPWDREYYSHLAAARRSTPGSSSINSNLSAYFSVGSCLQGLSELFTAIYGVSFEVETPEGPDELWHESVVKLGVVDEQEGRLGTIYCDLFAREGKTPGAAHYTVRCSRRTDLDEEHRDIHFADSIPPERPLIDQIYPDHLDAQPLQVPFVNNIPGKIGSYQRPVVVFSCSFEPPDPSSRQPSLLAWSDVETLFHEMGHAIHSMIGQTEYHNVSGTRCATDWVELPSILMEHFGRSAQVQGLFARHYHDDRPLSHDRFQAHLQQVERSRAADSQYQILLATLDQRFHSDIVADPAFCSTTEYRRLVRRLAVPPPPPAAAASDHLNHDTWHGRFGHLYGYGASYYSYLFDRVIAQKIWRHLVQESSSSTGPPGHVLDRANGERIKNLILRPGGSRDPWHCLASFFHHAPPANLDAHRLADLLAPGGKLAVQTVASWGLWDMSSS